MLKRSYVFLSAFIVGKYCLHLDGYFLFKYLGILDVKFENLDSTLSRVALGSRL